LLNEVGLSLFRYFEVGLRVCDIVVKKFTFAISSPDEFLFYIYNTNSQDDVSGASITASHCESLTSLFDEDRLQHPLASGPQTK